MYLSNSKKQNCFRGRDRKLHPIKYSAARKGKQSPRRLEAQMGIRSIVPPSCCVLKTRQHAAVRPPASPPLATEDEHSPAPGPVGARVCMRAQDRAPQALQPRRITQVAPGATSHSCKTLAAGQSLACCNWTGEQHLGNGARPQGADGPSASPRTRAQAMSDRQINKYTHKHSSSY